MATPAGYEKFDEMWEKGKHSKKYIVIGASEEKIEVMMSLFKEMSKVEVYELDEEEVKVLADYHEDERFQEYFTFGI